MLKADFHSHTNNIQNCETNYSPKQLIDRAAKEGFDVFCISEHYMLTKVGELLPEYRRYPFLTYEQYNDYAKEKGILLIRSVEIRYPEGEVLLVNFNGDVNDYPTIESLNNLPKDVLVIAPHPFFKRKICLAENLEKNIRLFDAVEYSHFYVSFFNLNKKAVEVAEKHKKPTVGTSDAHNLFELGTTYTLVDAEKTPEAVVKAVKQGRIKLVTKPMPLYLFAFVTLSSFYKMGLSTARIACRKLLKR